ncbi:MAG: sugar phosphate nucleotidyltransferase, partial [Myxococcota bacterium]
PDAVMGVVPSDHYITDEAGFAELAGRGFAAAEERDVIATVGVVPNRPETGYGYLKLGDALDGDRLFRVEAFVEKPDAETAQHYIESGSYLWNAGMFFVGARRLLRELATHMPETHTGLEQIAGALRSGGRAAAIETTERVYGELPSVSIDYGVMERADNVATVRGDFGWNDVGAWTALADYRPADKRGNVTQGSVVAIDCSDNIIISEGAGDGEPVAVAAVGVEGLVIVQSGNSILIVPRERAQDVRAVVAELKERELDQFL